MRFELWCTPKQRIVMRVFGPDWAEAFVFDINANCSRWMFRGRMSRDRTRALTARANAFAAWLRFGLGFNGVVGRA